MIIRLLNYLTKPRRRKPLIRIDACDYFGGIERVMEMKDEIGVPVNLDKLKYSSPPTAVEREYWRTRMSHGGDRFAGNANPTVELDTFIALYALEEAGLWPIREKRGAA